MDDAAKPQILRDMATELSQLPRPLYDLKFVAGLRGAANTIETLLEEIEFLKREEGSR